MKPLVFKSDGHFSQLPNNTLLDIGVSSYLVGISIVIDSEQTNAIGFRLTSANPATNTTNNTTSLLPIASETTGGLMSTESFVAIRELQSEIESLDGVVTYLNGKDFETSDIEELQPLFMEEASNQGYSQPLPNSLIINNWFDGHEYIYNAVTEKWVDYGTTVAALATNSSPGLVMGADSDGKVFAEQDGTMSVVGWDSLKSRLMTLEEELTGIDVVVTNLEGLL
jgi:hypothetical protein